MNARWIFLLPLESHLLKIASGLTCPDKNREREGGKKKDWELTSTDFNHRS
jgi:hypothetical protein